ncbi:MAG TPA: 16S rRNA (cytosine(1402)-N(4))-methyltransferase RsmH [Candidatus Saccharimonadales bacterium]|nr:16S rRNA (cytosine(1402)-N(4))-methyltransferase RsmH [Candidatus Saccharimonadales bacterium]
MSIKEHPPQQLHVPVLLDTTLKLLAPKKGENYLDLTAGYGGHAGRILELTENYADSVLVDRDDFAISHLQTFAKKGTRLMHTDFASAAKALVEEGRQFAIVLIDLGVSSPQLDRGERGFSFTKNGPLDMRMDVRQETSGETLVNTATKDELVRIITTYGEEPLGFARRIAGAIVEARPLRTTEDLARLIEGQYRGRWKRIHPATRTFQALRIAVNDELGQIESTLLLLPKLLKPGGRVGIISFHSLEDRLVKRFFTEQKQAGYEAELNIVTKKPLDGSIYDVHNPRSRSSKLRVAVKK